MISKYLSIICITAALFVIAGCETQNNYNSPFRAQYVFGLTQPEVSIKNNSDRTIDVSLFNAQSNSLEDIGETWTLEPSQTISTVFDPGEYQYYASCSGVIPASGTTLFQKNYRYSWVFYIESIANR